MSDGPINTLNDIDRLLIEADHTLVDGKRSVEVISRAIAKILCNYRPKVDLAYIEGRYRALASDTFLLAMPNKDLPSNLEVRDIVTESTTKFYLWMCINGPQEMASTVYSNHLPGPAQNLKNLKETGVLTLISVASHSTEIN